MCVCISLCVCVCMCVITQVLWHICSGQRTIWGQQICFLPYADWVALVSVAALCTLGSWPVTFMLPSPVALI